MAAQEGHSRGESRAGRAASEGKIVARVAPDGATGALVELNSETDFVARNEAFGQTVEKIADTLLARARSTASSRPPKGSPLLTAKFGDAGTLADSLKQLTGTIGENIVLRRYARFGGDGSVGAYVHHNGKVGTLVEVAGLSGEAGAAARAHRRRARHRRRADGPGGRRRATTFRRSSSIASAASSPSRPRPAASRRNIIEKMVQGRIDKYLQGGHAARPAVGARRQQGHSAIWSRQPASGVSIRRFARFQIGQE